MCTLSCDHCFCYSCLQSQIRAEVEKGHHITCPFEGCGVPLTHEKIRLIADMKGGNVLSEFYAHDARIAKSGTRGRDCPYPGCPSWYILDTDGEHDISECNSCSGSICTRCGEKYHYFGGCTELEAARLAWNQWKAADRQSYKGEAERAAHQIRQQEANARLEDLRKDEAWKAAHTRHCPHCQTVVEKLDGCNSMICGRNYHGGDDQRGCGKGFDWSTAAPYRSVVDVELFNVGVTAEDIARARSNQRAHDHFCSQCQKDIVGIRFQCAHCLDFNLCEDCETTAIHRLDHDTFLIIT